MPGNSSLAVLLAALVLASPAALAAPAARPPKLGLCAACHGDDGRSRSPGTPNLSATDGTYLGTAMAGSRSGGGRSAPLNAGAGSLQPRDIEALARWYSTRPRAWQ